MNVKVSVGTPVGGYKIEYFNNVEYWRILDRYLDLYSFQGTDPTTEECTRIATIADWAWIKEDS